MDYEALYQAYQILEKSLKEKTAVVVKLQKALSKEMDLGEVKAFSKDITTIQSITTEITQVLGEMESLVAGFDTRSYMEQGYFADQLLALCRDKGVDVVGDFPNFEIFPYAVHIDVDTQDSSINRKKVSCVRPASLMQRIQNDREKLMKASFNVLQFANELANAYDLALIKLEKSPDSDIYLQTLYKYLVPMSRFRKDYDQQSYAFDIARLYTAGSLEIKDGRAFQFGPSRNSNKSIRILDGEGREQFLATIRFFH
jgi:hypothetical protein